MPKQARFESDQLKSRVGFLLPGFAQKGGVVSSLYYRSWALNFSPSPGPRLAVVRLKGRGFYFYG